MQVIGLTGNIGSGKSTVARVFSRLGIPVYHADAESRKFLSEESVIYRIRESFGDVFEADGTVDRKKVASVVFSDSSKLSLLNSILHPLVREDFRKWISLMNDVPYVIQEAAIIFESGFRNEFSKVIHVSCPVDEAYQRVIRRDGLSLEQVKQRAAFQMDEKEKAAISDFVIINDGHNLVIPQVLEVHRRILEIPS